MPPPPPHPELAQARRLIVKVGSSLLTNAGDGLDIPYIKALCDQIAAARARDREIVIVSSGAVAAGVRRLGWHTRPAAHVDVQVAAAVGQMALINAYEAAFAAHAIHAAQALLSAEDMAHRTLYLNARTTLRRMLGHSVIPIINENDVIAPADICFGDNDRLAAQIANLIEADALLMLTDAPGLCRDARRLRDIIPRAAVTDPTLSAHAGPTAADGVGRGGIAAKLHAARIAARSGAHALICNGRDPNCIPRALAGDPTFGTLLVADLPRLSARKQWLANGLHPRGVLTLDDGAVTALVTAGRSLLPAGVRAVRGDFTRGDAVRLTDAADATIGYALVNYDSTAARRLCGARSDAIATVLGYKHEEEMAHRDNMTLVA